MDNRAFEAGASATPPTSPTSPSTGYPSNGNPATGSPATKPGEYWFHQVGEELRGVLAAASIAPDKAVLTQLLSALRSLFKPRATTIVMLTTSGNFTVPANITRLTVECFGGGAGGTGGNGASGAAGGYSKKSFDVTSGQVIAYTVGQGGVAGTMPTVGGNGTVTSFGAFCVANGGLAGATGQGGGLGAGGDLNITGQPGTDIDAITLQSAPGGNCPRGGMGGTISVGGGTPSALPGQVPGGGGAASWVTNTSGASSAGANGMVIVEY